MRAGEDSRTPTHSPTAPTNVLRFPVRLRGGVTIHCPREGCTHFVTEAREGLAVHALARHLVRDHALPTRGRTA